MRQILHADRDGKYLAIDNPDAVVVDHGAQMIRANLDRWPIGQPKLFRFLAHMLANADKLEPRASIGGALGNPRIASSTLCKYARSSEAILSALGMAFETPYGTGCYRLHTEPTETLECCRNLAPGQPLPWRLKSTPAAPGTPHMTCAKLPARSMTYLGRSSSRPSP
jgi:hypothetical protein